MSLKASLTALDVELACAPQRVRDVVAGYASFLLAAQEILAREIPPEIAALTVDAAWDLAFFLGRKVALGVERSKAAEKLTAEMAMHAPTITELVRAALERMRALPADGDRLRALLPPPPPPPATETP